VLKRATSAQKKRVTTGATPVDYRERQVACSCLTS